ncbi:MAG: hypothetical protein Q4E01_04450 [Actinomycetaceae bacterium]|nr:hypothetical protein [Actinomycetaceae bacterium]
MKRRSLLLALLTPLLLLLPVSAMAVPTIDGDAMVIDEVGVMSESSASDLEDYLLDTVGYHYYVVITRDWDGTSPDAWCSDLGEQNAGLQSSAIVYAIATELGEYNVCLGPAAPFDAERTNSAAQIGSAELRAGVTEENVRSAVKVMINELETPQESTDLDLTPLLPSTDNLEPTNQDAIDRIVVSFMVFVVLLIIGVVVITSLVRAGKRKKAMQASDLGRAQKLEAQIREVGVDLMRMDDAVRAADEDLAFAKAQFGELETAAFTKSLEEAKNLMVNAFEDQAKFDSTSDEREKERLLARIKSALGSVSKILNAQAKRFSDLRNVEANVAGNISSLRRRIEEARERVHRAELEIQSLRLTYSEQVLHSILDNPGEANRLLDAAAEALDNAEAEKNTKKQDAVFYVNLALRALTQALSQINEVLEAEENLSDVKNKLVQAIASISSDLEDVKRLAPNQTLFGPLVEDAHAAIQNGNLARRGQSDPLEALEQLHEAEDALDNALDPLRGESEKNRVQYERLDRRFGEVDSAIMRADARISAHPGLFSSEPRRYLAIAKSKRQSAADASSIDPEKALRLLADALAYVNRAEGALAPIQVEKSEPMSLSTMLVLGGLLFGNNSGRGGWGGSNNWGGSSGWGSSGGFGGGFTSGGSGGFGGGFSGGSGGFGGGFSSGGSGKF